MKNICIFEVRKGKVCKDFYLEYIKTKH